MKNFCFATAQSGYVPYKPLAQVTEGKKNIPNKFPLHFVSQSFLIDYYNKGKENCQAPSFLFFWTESLLTWAHKWNQMISKQVKMFFS